jgi:ribosomal protein L40E
MSWLYAFLISDLKKNGSIHIKSFNIENPLWRMVLVAAGFSILFQVLLYLPLPDVIYQLIAYAPSIVMLGMILNDVIRNFSTLILVQGEEQEYSLLSYHGVQTEAEGLVVDLKNAGLHPIIINTRPFAIWGTRFPWSQCVPRVPFLVLHRALGGGAVRVFIRNDEKEKAVELMKLSMHGTVPDVLESKSIFNYTKCSKCGFENQKEDTVCSKCGNNLLK